MGPSRRKAAAFLLLVVLPACYATYTVPLGEVPSLDGYDVHGANAPPGSERMLYTVNGNIVRLDSDTPLYFLSQGGERLGGKISTLYVRGGRVSGTLLDGEPFSLALADLDCVQVTAPDIEKDKVALVIAAAVTATLGIVLAGYLWAHSTCESNCQSTNDWGAQHGIPPLPCNCP